MIDKIKGILKKEDISAPKVLPELLSEQIRTTNSEPTKNTEKIDIEPKAEEIKPQTKDVRVEVTPDSANFIDDDIDDLSPEMIEPQEKYKPVQFKVEVPKVEIKKEEPKQEAKQEPKQIIQPSLPRYELVREEKTPNVQINISGDNFFTKVENIVGADSNRLKELLEGDLFENMRLYHKKLEDGEKLFFHVSEIENAIREKVVHLKVLEDEWLIEKHKLENQEKIFLNKEEELFSGIEELKSLFNKLEVSKKLKKDISINQSFILKDGTRIFSVAGLKKSLINMNNETYNFHVNDSKNDFASWLETVFGSHELARDLRNSLNKEAAINVLKDF